MDRDDASGSGSREGGIPASRLETTKSAGLVLRMSGDGNFIVVDFSMIEILSVKDGSKKMECVVLLNASICSIHAQVQKAWQQHCSFQHGPELGANIST